MRLNPYSQAHRRELRSLTNLAERDLQVLWREVGSADLARSALQDILPALTDRYGLAAASLAADYYDGMRERAGARGRFEAITAEPAGRDKLSVLARVAVRPLFGDSPDLSAALVLARGGLQRHVANAARDTVTVSSIQDRDSTGWVRVGSGECPWCAQFLDGAVHAVEYDFNAHDHCGCTAQPVFRS